MSHKVFNFTGINGYHLFKYCSMFVPTVSIATVCSSLCSLPHFISTLIEIINTSVLTLKTFSLTCLAWHNFCKCNREHKKLKQINSPWCFNCYCLRFAVRPTCDFGHVLPTIRYGSVWKCRRKVIQLKVFYCSFANLTFALQFVGYTMG